MTKKLKFQWGMGICLVGGLALFQTAFGESGPATPSISALLKNYERPTQIPYPESNPYTKEKEELGKALFYDPRVSHSQMISCATCHNPSFSWGDSLAKGVGNGHKQLGRRTPTILNLAWNTGRLFWDGRATDLEDQATGPIKSEGEMAMPLDELLPHLKSIKGYHPMFEKAFPEQKGDLFTVENISKAIATYERTVVSGTAPFDRFVKGDQNAISESAKRGFVTFNGKAKCISCHSGWNFTDGSFQDIGLPGDDVGRGKFLTKLVKMQHAFKTPTLRNVDHRGPYMHDGSEKTLEDVVEFYNIGGKVKRDSVSDLIQPLGLTSSEKADLVAFLKTLTSVDQPQTLPILPR